MTRRCWVECMVLGAFWIASLTGFMVGGRVVLGAVVQIFLVGGFGWVAYQLYRDAAESWRIERYRNQIFADWAKRQRPLKGMDQ